jgi:hypothetical protein
MTLNETVHQKVADWQPGSQGRQTLLIPDEGSGWQVRVTADRHDQLSSALWELNLQRTSQLADTSKTVETWATQVADRVTGLLESLHVVEVDVHRNEALLRSTEPTRRGKELHYYEIILTGTERAAARRYRGFEQQGRREQILFALTHETLSKFAADLAALPT